MRASRSPGPVLAPLRPARGRTPPVWLLAFGWRDLQPPSRIEYRPKLGVFDAIVEGYGVHKAQRMAGAKKLRTDDFFAAVGFILRRGEPSKKEAA